MSSVRRRPDWVTRLVEHINGVVEARPAFGYGTHDCVTFAVDCVRVMTDRDPGRQMRKYTTIRGANFRLAKHGGLVGIANKAFEPFGWTEVPPLKAQRGDVVQITTPMGEAMGVVDLNGELVLVADEVGIRAMPLSMATRAWRIG